ncbi:MAG: xanthine dehydrogenase family protein molybdopterin-binding subunit [Rhodospirillaceae bacterium]|nr:xanthine dehydrogenase family protein molybdopterin-binding subunit [Rhodospirillaceae bacterium]MBT6857651.1 xanthine dehydrogenase family protein molybdopterin-binding subunit [Rhodospirillaceae bacterium]
MAQYGIGQPVRREEDPRHLKGGGRFINDNNLAGQLHAYLVRSTHAHAAIGPLDIRAAAAAPGVAAVFTGEDVIADGVGTPKMQAPHKRPGGAPLFHRAHRGLSAGFVKYVGDPIAMVIAASLDQAKDAAELIQVDYDPLLSVNATHVALADGAPAVWPENPDNIAGIYEVGDEAATDAAIAGAYHVVKRRLVINRVYAQYMEPRGALASYDAADERYTLYVDIQYPHRLRNVLAEDILKVPEQNIHIIAGDIGGGFGTKGWQYPEHRLTMWAARKLGRPVKWTCERSEAVMADEHGRDNISEAELGFDADGNITGLRVRTVANVGAYVSSVRNFLATFGCVGGLNGVYRIPAAHDRVTCVNTNMNATAPYRGAGRPEAIYVIERMMDEAALELGIDTIELRRRNIIPESAMPYETALTFTYDCGAFEKNMDDVLALASVDDLAARRIDAEARGKLLGFGFANAIEQAAAPGLEFAEVRFNVAGTATILMGTKSQGQGHETMYKQIVAERLGMDYADVRVVDGDTDKVSYGNGTSGSRSAVLGGSSLHIALGKVIDKTKRIAAHMLEAAEGDVEFENGRFTITGTDKSLDFNDVARAAYQPGKLPAEIEPGLYETGTFRATKRTFPNGAHTCEVELDPETGKVDITNYCVADDVGTVINPLTLKGQIHGGIAQGAGQILMEQVVFDADSGQLLTGSFMDYAMPRADDFGAMKIISNPVPTATNPLGVKGAGEAGTVGALPAVMNAILDALRQAGVTDLDMPATPERVWQAIQEAKA